MIVKFFIFFMLILSACDSHEIVSDISDKQNGVKIYAGADFNVHSMSRSSADNEGKFSWMIGDNIGVLVSNQDVSNFQEFQLISGENTNKGVFRGILFDDDHIAGYAVYPYNKNHQFDSFSGNLSIRMPKEYGDFDTEYSENTYSPMIATISSNMSDEYTCDFKHLGSVLRFSIDGVPQNSAKFIFSTNLGISGDFPVQKFEDCLSINAKSFSNDNNTVSINFKPLPNKRMMNFCIPLPIGNYQGFTISIHDKNGNQLVTHTTNVTNLMRPGTLKQYPKMNITDINGSIEEEQFPHFGWIDDDSKKYVYEYLYPWAVENRVPFTSAAITNYVELNHKGWLSMDKVLEMYRNHPELVNFASHTKDHITASNLPVSDVIQQYVGSKDDINSWNVNACELIVYPGGQVNDSILSVVPTNYKFGFQASGPDGAAGTRINYAPFDRFKLKRRTIGQNCDVERIKKEIDITIKTKGMLVFMSHVASKYSGNTDLEAEFNVYNEVLSYIRSKGYDIEPVDKICEIHSQYTNQNAN